MELTIFYSFDRLSVFAFYFLLEILRVSGVDSRYEKRCISGHTTLHLFVYAKRIVVFADLLVNNVSSNADLFS